LEIANVSYKKGQFFFQKSLIINERVQDKKWGHKFQVSPP